MTDEEVRSVADEVLHQTLGPYGFVKSLVRSGYNHEGEPALFIRAHFKPGSGPVPGKPSMKALSALSEALSARGETRFPYLRHFYPDDEFPEDVPAELLGLP